MAIPVGLSPNIIGDNVFLGLNPSPQQVPGLFTIDWGDGSLPLVTSASGANREVEPGTYTGKISHATVGTFTRQYTVELREPNFRLRVETHRGGQIVATDYIYRPIRLAAPSNTLDIPVQAGDQLVYALEEHASGPGVYVDTYLTPVGTTSGNKVQVDYGYAEPAS